MLRDGRLYQQVPNPVQHGHRKGERGTSVCPVDAESVRHLRSLDNPLTTKRLEVASTPGKPNAPARLLV